MRFYRRGYMRGKLSILIFFNHQLSKEILSGGEKMFLEVSKRFHNFGVNLHAVVPEISIGTLREEGLSFKFFTIPCFKFEFKSYLESAKDMFLMLFVYAYRSIYCTIQALRWLRECQAEVIYSTGDFIPNTMPAAFATLFNRRKLKWIALIHHIIDNPLNRRGTSFLSNSGSFLMQKFSFFLIRRFSDGVFVKNNEVKDKLVKSGFNIQKIFIIDNGVDIKKIQCMEADYPDPFDACYIGRLSASKGILDLIKIWNRVISDLPDAKLAIIGGGSAKLEEAKRDFVKSLNLQNNVKILGSLPDEEAYRIRKTSKIFLSCSYEEGWGITIAESLACGVPCIVYDLPVYTEKFDGAIEKVPKGDIESFAKRVINLLQDQDKRSKMILCGKEIVKRYDIEDVVKQEIKVIKRILLDEC